MVQVFPLNQLYICPLMLTKVDGNKLNYLYCKLYKSMLHFKPTKPITNTSFNLFIHKTHWTQNMHITHILIHTHKNLKLLIKWYSFSIIFNDE